MKINGINEPFILFNKIITTNFARLAFTIKKEAYNGRITYKGFVVELL